MEEVEEHPRNLSLSNKKHISSECNVKSTVSNACNDSVCLMPKKCLSNDCDENVSNNVNDKPAQKNEPRSRTRYIERLINRYKFTTSRIPRRFLKHCIWIPTGREFTFKDSNLVIVEPKHVEHLSNVILC